MRQENGGAPEGPREMASRVAEQEGLLRVARRAAGGAPMTELAGLVAEEVARLLGVEAGIVWRFDDGGSVVVASHGDHGSLPGVVFPLSGSGALVTVARTGRPARARYRDMPGDDPTAVRVVGQGYVSGIAAPIVVSESRPWGAVLAATTAERELPADAEERLGRFAELVSLGIAAAESREELARRAALDDLTGIANRGEFRRRLEDEASRALRHGRPLALVLLDIDHFKRINDGAGHPAGDRVLRAVAARLRRLRAEDLTARVGGEEFALVLPETDATAAAAVAERARRSVAAMREPGLPPVTLSAGVAELADAVDADALVAAADAALYLAKRRGRDRVERYDPSRPHPTAGDDPPAGPPELVALRDLAAALRRRLRGGARALPARWA